MKNLIKTLCFIIILTSFLFSNEDKIKQETIHLYKFKKSVELLESIEINKYDSNSNLIKQSYYDSDGDLAPQEYWGSSIIYKYDSNNNLIKESHYDVNGNLVNILYMPSIIDYKYTKNRLRGKSSLD